MLSVKFLVVLVFIISVFGSLPTKIDLGFMSLSAFFSLLIPALYLYKCNHQVFDVKRFKIAPLLAMLSMLIVWDIIKISSNQYYLHNTTLALMGFTLTFIFSQKYYSLSYQKIFINAIEKSSYLYIVILSAVVFLYQEEPAITQVGVLFFSYHLIKYFRYRIATSLFICGLIFIETAVLSSRIIVVAELFIAFLVLIRYFKSTPFKFIFFITFGLIVVSYVSGTDWFIEKISGGDQSFQLGGFDINTSGRIFFWEHIYSSILEKPWLGHGIAIPEDMRSIAKWSHPHNDYLRFLHHIGIVGLFFWIWFIFEILKIGFSALRFAGHINDKKTSSEIILTVETGIVFLFGVLVMMSTDNTIVYTYVTYPLGLFLGVLVAVDRIRLTR